MRRLLQHLALAALVAPLLSSCGAAGTLAGDVAGAVPAPAIEATLDALEEQRTREQMAALAASPEIRDATRDLASSLMDGTLDALGEEERAARIGELADGFVARVSAALASALDGELGASMADAIARVMDRSLQRALDADGRERIAGTVAAIATESAAAMGAAMRDELGPAMRVAIREELAPALREAIEDDRTQHTLAVTARALSREMVLGVQDGFAEIQERQEEGEARDSIVTRLQSMTAESSNLLEIGVLVMTLALIAMILWLVRAIARSRRFQAEAKRRDEAIVALTDALRGLESRPWARELREHLRRVVPGAQAEYFRDLFRGEEPPSEREVSDAIDAARADRDEAPPGPLEPAT